MNSIISNLSWSTHGGAAQFIPVDATSNQAFSSVLYRLMASGYPRVIDKLPLLLITGNSCLSLCVSFQPENSALH